MGLAHVTQRKKTESKLIRGKKLQLFASQLNRNHCRNCVHKDGSIEWRMFGMDTTREHKKL